jgi:chromatin remodeling complex protein RSC6
LILSPALCAVFNNEYTELGRPEVVKKLWEYIKSNDLQDPKDKRFIICDSKLKKIFHGGSRVSSFGMNKYLSDHLTKKESVDISIGGDDDDDVTSMEEHDDDANEEKGDEEMDDAADEVEMEIEEGDVVKPEAMSP